METNTQNNILKKESVGYLKSALNLQQGQLIMTPTNVLLTAHKSTVGGGLLGALLKSYVEKEKNVFDLKYGDIKEIKRGKHGVETNVLEIIDNSNNRHRMIVKNYQEWEDLLKKQVVK